MKMFLYNTNYNKVYAHDAFDSDLNTAYISLDLNTIENKNVVIVLIKSLLNMLNWSLHFWEIKFSLSCEIELNGRVDLIEAVN